MRSDERYEGYSREQLILLLDSRSQLINKLLEEIRDLKQLLKRYLQPTTLR